MKKLFFTLFFTALFLSLAAQDVKSDRIQMERILANRDNYVTATGRNDTLEVAVNNAIATLSQEIQTTVVSIIKTDTDIHVGGKEVDEDTRTKIEITTLSQVKLKGVSILTVKEPDRKNSKYEVFVYIEKSKLDEIYEETKAEELAKLEAQAQKTAADVKYYYEEGRNAIKDLRIGDALKCWYWAYAMSLGNIGIKINDSPADRVLETEIDKVMGNIRVEAISCEKEQINEDQAHYKVILDIRYKDSTSWRKVTNLDYRYNDGYGWQDAPRARDGVGKIDLRRDIDKVSFQCVYCYGEGETPKDVEERINRSRTKRFNSADKTVVITSKAKMRKDVVVNSGEVNLPVSKSSQVETDEVAVVERDHSELHRRMTRIEKAIRELNSNSVRSLFTEESYKSFQELIMYGKASIIGMPQYTFLDYGPMTI